MLIKSILELKDVLQKKGFDLTYIVPANKYPEWLLKKIAKDTELDLFILKRLNEGIGVEINIPNDVNYCVNQNTDIDYDCSKDLDFDFKKELDFLLNETLEDITNVICERAANEESEESEYNIYSRTQFDIDLPSSIKENPLVDILINELKQYKRLSLKGMKRAKKKYDEGDITAFESLVITGLPWILKIAYKELEYEDQFLDLFQEGVLGLIKAIKYWEPSKTHLRSFCGLMIITSIRRYKSRNGSVIRLPVSIYERKEKYKKALRRKHEQSKKFINEKDLAKVLKPLSLNSDIRYVNDIKYEDQLLELYEQPLPEDMLLFEDICDPSSLEEEIIERIYYNEIKQWLDKCNLKTKEKNVINYRYGFNGEPKTLGEIAKIMGVTRQRINQIEKKALKKLRKYAIKK